MESLDHSETATLAAPENAHLDGETHPTLAYPKLEMDGRTPLSHDGARADLSFPFETTDLERGGMTDEYRIVSRLGMIPADEALRPIPSRLYRIPTALRREKGILRETQLVTWRENDPEDPRNWSNSYRWCRSSTYSLLRKYISDTVSICI